MQLTLGFEDSIEQRKAAGAYYTPDDTARSLVRWVVRRPTDRLLDPACGNGQFLQFHEHAVGVEQDAVAAAWARLRAPGATVYEEDFFAWAKGTAERFDCAAGNPPFIRYQRFSGQVRQRALSLCRSMGVEFSSLSSSWAPFLVATASLLKAGGHMAFVVPAEIGHAPYATPLLRYLTGHFGSIQVVAIREKLFPDLSENCWLLAARGFGETTDFVKFTAVERFAAAECPPEHGYRVGLEEWQSWKYRLRPFLLSPLARRCYQDLASRSGSVRLGQVARVSIGYVSGANDFFHLRPSVAFRLGIPDSFLVPAVRNGRMLQGVSVTQHTVDQWLRRDEPVLLLRIQPADPLPDPVRRYLTSAEADVVKSGFKCRNRRPWYVVPDVRVPDAFLSYMTGNGAVLVSNEAGCVCTNSVHAVTLTGDMTVKAIQRRWQDPLTALSCELEGHPLGGGMLKLEPREATRVLLGHRLQPSPSEHALIDEAIRSIRRWRHHG